MFFFYPFTINQDVNITKAPTNVRYNTIIFRINLMIVIFLILSFSIYEEPSIFGRKINHFWYILTIGNIPGNQIAALRKFHSNLNSAPESDGLGRST